MRYGSRDLIYISFSRLTLWIPINFQNFSRISMTPYFYGVIGVKLLPVGQIDCWNALPTQTVSPLTATSIASFKKRLNATNFSLYLHA